MENMWKTYWEPLATDKDGEKRVHIDKFVGEFNQDTKQGRELESRTLKLGKYIQCLDMFKSLTGFVETVTCYSEELCFQIFHL